MRSDESLPVPSEMRIDRGYLAFSVTRKYVAPKPTMLHDFLSIAAEAEVRFKERLRDSNISPEERHAIMTGDTLKSFIADSDILEFARRWGVMGFCHAHERPGCSAERCSPERLSNGYEACERLELWRDKILEALTMQRIGESLTLGEAGLKRDWKLVIFEVRDKHDKDDWGQP